MPRWGTHLLVANNILKKRKDISKNEFLFGNILPDLQSGYLITDVSNISSHVLNHYKYDNGIPTYINFLNAYDGKLDNSMLLGYYSHIITDYYFNKWFKERLVYDENMKVKGYKNNSNDIVLCTKDEATIAKQEDFKKFDYYLYENYDIQMPTYDESIIGIANEVKQIHIIGDDVKKVVAFLEEEKVAAKTNKRKLDIYKEEELEEEIEKVTDIILELLDKLK